MKILSFGEVLWDIYPEEKCIGGAPFNFASHLALQGEEVYMLTSAGSDSLGALTVQEIAMSGVRTDYIGLNDKRTGQCIVSLNESGRPVYELLEDVAYDYIDCKNVKDNFDVLYFGTLALRCRYNAESLEYLIENQEFRHIFVDINLRKPFYTIESVSFACKNATILKISREELQEVLCLTHCKACQSEKNAAKELSGRFCNIQMIIITMDSDGAFVYDCRNKREYFCPAVKTQVVSSVGAGDSYSAAFLHKYLKGCDISCCMNYAAEVSSRIVSVREAVTDKEFYELFLN